MCVILHGALASIGCEGSLSQEGQAGVDEPDLTRSSDEEMSPTAGLDMAGGPGTDLSVVPDAAMSADQGGESPGCIDVEEEFLKGVYAPVLAPRCQSCHNPLGTASTTAFTLALPELEADHIRRNLSTLEALAAQEIDGSPKLLVKPTGAVPHGGGVVLEEGSESLARLERFVQLANEAEFCAPRAWPPLDDRLVPYTPLEHGRRIAMALAGRDLTIEEHGALQDGSLRPGELADRVMEEEAFLEIFELGFNDTFHLRGGIDLNANYLSERDFPDRVWYNEIADDEVRQRHARAASVGLKRAPLELMRHLVANDLPFTGVLTADYTMVNYALAKSYGVEAQVDFGGAEDPDVYQPARLRRAEADVALPHAGVLTTPLFLRIYGTTETNRNRGRARIVYDFFLDTNVLEVAAEGGGDSQEVAELENPVRDAEQCRQCHYLIEPMAGAFQNFDQNGRWAPRRGGWYEDTFAPGFISSTGEVLTMSGEDSARALQWTAGLIASDPRFARAMVAHTYFAVMGVPPLELPRAAEQEGYLGRLQAYTEQQAWFREVEREFLDQGANLKVIYRAVVSSRYFATRRVEGDAEALDPDTWASYEGVTRTVVLTPEQLQRKITAIFGEPWMLYGMDAILTTHPLPYNALLGAIDSTETKTRPQELTTFMAAATSILAGEVSCKLAMPDFQRPAAQRKFFPHVEKTTSEETDAAAVRQNIAHLYWVILGEEHDVESPDVEALFDLFVAVRQHELGQHPEGSSLRGACSGEEDPALALHAWRAVVMYMLEDWAFLHQF